jgi:predicted transcriptional regulator
VDRVGSDHLVRDPGASVSDVTEDEPRAESPSTDQPSTTRQYNLRLSDEVVEDLDRLASERGIKGTRLAADILEAYVQQETKRLAEIYRRDAERAARRAVERERRAVAAERHAPSPQPPSPDKVGNRSSA